MGDAFGRPGVYRGTAQGVLLGGLASGTTNTDGCISPVRVFEVNFTVTATASPIATNMVLATCIKTSGNLPIASITNYPLKTVVSTAGSSATTFLTVYHEQTRPVGFGQWKSSAGMLFPYGVFVQTPTAMGYYTIVYSEVT